METTNSVPEHSKVDECSRSCMDHLNEIDEPTAALIIQLQRQDLDEVRAGNEGKDPEDESVDAQSALELFNEDLKQAGNALTDRAMSRSLTQAVIADAAAVTADMMREDAVARDFLIADRLGQGQDIEDNLEVTNQQSDIDDLMVARLQALFVSGVPDEDDEATADGSEENGRVLCDICREHKRPHDVLQAPCGDRYCEQCLSQLFELCLVDESAYPPRCHRQEIPSSSARLYLSKELLLQFNAKATEYNTSNRTYCSDPTCSTFIPPSNVADDRGTCPACAIETCAICKAAAHDGDCPEDTETQQALEAARQMGLQRCYNCRRMIELSSGCYHMTCLCGAQFCYFCGAHWKNCNCAHWDDDRLLDRAEEIVAREPAAQLDAVEHEQRVHQVAEEMRQGHECVHEGWRFVNGRHQCEECSHMLPQYIFECRQCRIRACWRCRRNRL